MFINQINDLKIIDTNMSDNNLHKQNHFMKITTGKRLTLWNSNRVTKVLQYNEVSYNTTILLQFYTIC